MGYKIYKVNNKGKGTFNDVPPEDIVEVGSNLSNGDVYDANSYSTDEIKTGGTWIDGKPIYRKVINLDFVNSGGVSGINLRDFINNIDFLMPNTSVSFTYEEEEEDYLIFTGLVTSNYTIVIRNNILMFRQAINPSQTYIMLDGNYKIIVEYTKTTDQNIIPTTNTFAL